MGDVLNAEANVVFAADGVRVDEDLVTGFSKRDAVPFIEAVARQIVAVSGQRT
jgi:hypothetical protein